MAFQALLNLTTVFHVVSDAISDKADAIWQLRDRRVDGWPLMSSPIPTVVICATYVFIVKIVGPRMMEGRPPFQLKTFLVVYNAFQVGLSAYIFVQLLRGGWWKDYNYFCQGVDYSDSPKAMLMLHAAYAYYLSKFTEFVDTFTFVARKKLDHVSLLHVVHHGIMPLSVWPGVRFLPGGHSSFFALANTFVHIVMYTYYLIAALGPNYQRYIFWKQHLTTLQMIQFVAIMVHGFQLMFYDECEFPHQFAYYIAAHAVMFFVLFAHFYVKSYLSPRKPKGSGGSQGAASAKLKADKDDDEVKTGADDDGMRVRGRYSTLTKRTGTVANKSELGEMPKPESIEIGAEILPDILSEINQMGVKINLMAENLTEIRSLLAVKPDLDEVIRRTLLHVRMGQRKLSKIDEGVILDGSPESFGRNANQTSTPSKRPGTYSTSPGVSSSSGVSSFSDRAPDATFLVSGRALDATFKVDAPGQMSVSLPAEAFREHPGQTAKKAFLSFQELSPSDRRVVPDLAGDGPMDSSIPVRLNAPTLMSVSLPAEAFGGPKATDDSAKKAFHSFQEHLSSGTSDCGNPVSYFTPNSEERSPAPPSATSTVDEVAADSPQGSPMHSSTFRIDGPSTMPMSVSLPAEAFGGPKAMDNSEKKMFQSFQEQFSSGTSGCGNPVSYFTADADERSPAPTSATFTVAEVAVDSPQGSPMHSSTFRIDAPSPMALSVSLPAEAFGGAKAMDNYAKKTFLSFQEHLSSGTSGCGDLMSDCAAVSVKSSTTTTSTTSKVDTLPSDVFGGLRSSELSFQDVAALARPSDMFGRDPDFTFEGAGEPLFGSSTKSSQYPETYDQSRCEEQEIYKQRAKGYRYDSDCREWKEIGIGTLSILKHESKEKFRLVLTRDQVFKIAINHYIDDNMELKAMDSSFAPAAVSYVAHNFVKDVLKPECLAIKFRTEHTLEEFENVIRSCQEKIKASK